MAVRIKRISQHADEPLQQTIEVEGISYTFGVNESKSLPDHVADAIAAAASGYDARDRVRVDSEPGEARS